MKITKPQYFDYFKCVADKCEDTCCRFWQVELDRESFDEVSRFNNIKIKGRKDQAVILPCKNGGCPFLEDSLLCSLHKEVGHDRLPRTCRLYPRFINTFGGYEEQGLSFSCPTAARLIYSNPLRLIEEENEAPITSYTEVDANLFSAILKIRSVILEYLRNTEDKLETAVGRLLAYSEKADRIIKEKDTESEELYLVPSAPIEFEYSEKIFNKTVSVHLKNTFLRKEWKQKLKSTKFGKNNEDLHAFKVWFSYFIYRYLLRSAVDLEFPAVIRSALLSYFLIARIGEEPCVSMQLYSKETEHNERNISRLFKLGRKLIF